MKRKIEEHYGENIIVAKINRKPNVVTFTTTASIIFTKNLERMIVQVKR